jgi:serine/threonine-protein kinase
MTKRHRIVIGVTALATVGALGGFGAATTSAAPNSDNAMNKLMGVLPGGYTSSNCQPVDSPPADSLATVDCQQNSRPNGPSVARFSLYPDRGTLDAHFQSSANADELSPCPGGLQSPGNWHYNNNPNVPAGKIACGTYKGRPDLTWSQYDQGLLGDIQGDDLQSLYTFWSKNS